MVDNQASAVSWSQKFSCRVIDWLLIQPNFQVKEIYNFTQDDLTTEDILVLDCCREIYVWIGCHSDLNSRQQALNIGQVIIHFNLQCSRWNSFDQLLWWLLWVWQYTSMFIQCASMFMLVLTTFIYWNYFRGYALNWCSI